MSNLHSLNGRNFSFQKKRMSVIKRLKEIVRKQKKAERITKIKHKPTDIEKTRHLINQIKTNRIIQKLKSKISFVYLIKRHAKRRKNVDKISLEEIANIAGSKAIPLLICILNLPTAIPLPYPPGFVGVVGAIGMMLSLQMFLGYSRPYLPRFIMRLTIKKKFLIFIVEKFQLIILKSHGFIKERLTVVVSNSIIIRLIGFLLFVLGVFLFLPIPFTNVPIGMSITLIALGMIMRDGLLVLLGIIPGVIGIAMCISDFALIKIAIIKMIIFI